MKRINQSIFLLILLLFSACEKNENDFSIDPRAEFYIKYEESVLVMPDQIDFYDFSSHLLYLKEGNPVLDGILWGSFSVFVGDDEIYSGRFFPGFSSSFPIGVYVHTMPTFYGDYIVPISYSRIVGFEEEYEEDPRNDIRIVQALKKHNQYRRGLQCEMLAVTKSRNNTIKVLLQLTNNDALGIYFLDPEKMGVGLFHYFTNGLYLRDEDNKVYTNNITAKHPHPWNSYKMEWMSELKAKESVLLSIVYDDFDNIPSGEFDAGFTFPGLGYQVNRKDIQQEHGRIWLGELHLEKQIVIE